MVNLWIWLLEIIMADVNVVNRQMKRYVNLNPIICNMVCVITVWMWSSLWELGDDIRFPLVLLLQIQTYIRVPICVSMTFLEPLNNTEWEILCPDYLDNLKCWHILMTMTMKSFISTYEQKLSHSSIWNEKCRRIYVVHCGTQIS